MTLAILKLVFCTILAWGSLAVFLFTRNRPWRDNLYKVLVLSVFALRVIAPILIYSSRLPFPLTSDASNYYMPQALELVSGRLPYRDFASCYSPLFLPLVALAITIWRSVGSIVITMTLLDGGMVAAYLLRCRRKKVTYGWSVAFLYSFSPASLYWIGVVGHNGSIIALAIMISLITAERHRDYFAGLIEAAGFLCSKLLAIMYWPVIIYYRQAGRIKRALPLVASLLLLTTLTPFGFDCLSPAKHEFSNYTSGNIWFLLSRFIPGFLGSIGWQLLPSASFGAIFIFLFFRYMRTERHDPTSEFDRASVFVAVITFLFLILSKKSNTFYITMGLLPLIHVLIRDRNHLIRRLVPLAYIGSITTIELILWHTPSFSENVLGSYRGIIFVLMELLLLLCYVYLIVICMRVFIHQGKQLACGQLLT